MMLSRLLNGFRRTNRPPAADGRETPLRVAIVSFDEPAFPCARIRLLDPLRKCGQRVEVRHALRHTDAGWVFDDAALEWAQLIVAQRGLPREDTRALCERVLAAGRPVVYETDDCLPEIPAYHGKDHYRLNGPFILEFASRASLVTVSTEPLRQYFEAHEARAVVLPNFLDEDLWNRDLASAGASPRPQIRVGYVGNRGHRGDLEIVAPVLRRLLDESPHLQLVFLGCAPDGFEQTERCEVIAPDFNYATFPQRLAALDLDIAIAPLLDNAFNRCVSNLKFLEYGFLGIPGVYSDVPAYNGSVHSTTGLLCGASEAEWYSALRSLAHDPALRASMGRAAQQQVRSEWMLAPHAQRWLDTYAAVVASGGRDPAQPFTRA